MTGREQTGCRCAGYLPGLGTHPVGCAAEGPTTLWTDESWELGVLHHKAEARRDARRIVREGFRKAGLMPRRLPPAGPPTREALHMERALLALDAIRLGVEGRLRLKGQLLSPFGVTTVHSEEPVRLRDAQIVRAAKRALTGEVVPRARL